MTDKKKRKNTDTARRIWLAGIGAYGKAYTEAKETLKGVAGDGSEIFDDLVQKGQMIEMTVGAKSKEMLGKAGVSDLSMPDLHIDERIKKMRDRIKSSAGFDDAPEASAMDRLDALEAKLDEILAILKPAPKKTAPKRTAAKKPAAKKKTTAKKAAPKKTVTKKTVTKKTIAKKS